MTGKLPKCSAFPGKSEASLQLLNWNCHALTHIRSYHIKYIYIYHMISYDMHRPCLSQGRAAPWPGSAPKPPETFSTTFSGTFSATLLNLI
jgi:hypothetical protein